MPRKWILCLLMFLATTLNYLDRQTLSILAPVIQQELRLDNVALGWLFSVFYYSYTLAQFGVGALLDRWHLRWTYAAFVLLWSAAAALTGLATGFAGLIAFRLLLGVMESANWPAAMRIVARVLPPEERALGNGIFTSGTSVGALIAPAVILGAAGWLGWRWSFAVVGSAGLVWLVLWLWFTRSKELDSVWRSGEGTRAGGWQVYRQILTQAQFWRVWIIAVLVNPCLYFSVNWLPTYFVQQRGFVAGKDLGVVLTLIYLGLDLGYLFCGTSVLWLTRRGMAVAAARRWVFLLATVLVCMSVYVPAAPTREGAAAALAVVNFGIGIWIATYLTLGQEVSPTYISTAAGLLGGSGSLAGAIAMWAVGRVTQSTGSFAAPLGAVAVAVTLAALAGLAAVRTSKTHPGSG